MTARDTVNPRRGAAVADRASYLDAVLTFSAIALTLLGGLLLAYMAQIVGGVTLASLRWLLVPIGATALIWVLSLLFDRRMKRP